MKKAKKKHRLLGLIWVVLSPVAVFAIAALLRYFNGGTVTANMFLVDFTLFFSEIKTLSQYIFPIAAVLCIGLAGVIIKLLRHKRISLFTKLLYLIFSVYLILTGSRILFALTRKITSAQEFITFIHGGITLYSFTLSLFISMLIIWILSFFYDGN